MASDDARSVPAEPAEGDGRRSVESSRTLVQATSLVGVFEVHDLVTGRSVWSEGLWHLLGLSPGEQPSTRFYLRHVHPDDRPDVRDVLSSTVVDRQPKTTEHRIVRPDGEVRWVTITFAGVSTGGSDEVTELRGAAMDVTDLRRAEAERSDAVVQRLRAELRLRAGFESSPVGIVETDADGRVITANRAFCRLVGLNESEVVGRRSATFAHPADDPAALTPRADMIAGMRSTFEAEHRLLRTDGTELWVHKTVSLVHEPGEAPHFLSQLQDVSEQRRSADRLHHLAYHDPLTGLPNRSMFVDHVGRALARVARRPDEMVMCLFLDLDQFKVVNDALGHAAGDELLVAVAARLRGALRSSDLLARFGGDEFVVAVVNGGEEHAVALGARMAQAVSEPFRIAGSDIVVTVSVGVAGAQDVSTAEDLIQRADAAMYRAKERGRNRVELFDTELHRRVHARMDVEVGLRRALERGELELHHQPIVELASERVVGIEALLRWRRDDGHLVGPDEFLEVAEVTGLIIPIGEWVIGEAVRVLARCRREVPGAGRLCVSLNLSSRQLRDPGLLDVVSQALAGFDGPPGAVHLEMTESTLMGDAADDLQILQRLRALGVGLVVDDFGTGYSSLSYLSRLPVSSLKLDRSFVEGLSGGGRREHAVVAAVVSLATALELDVVAEGVEEAGQLGQLRSLGVRLGQGWLWAPALPSDELLDWLRTDLDGGAARANHR